MSMKIPSITSPLANQALRAKPGEEILIGHDAEEYASLILTLLENETLAKKLAENGHRFIHQNFNWAAATAVLEKVMMES